MHLDNGELVPDYDDLEDVQLYATALAWGSVPTPQGSLQQQMAYNPRGSHANLVGNMPAGYFYRPMDGSEAIVRGCIKLAASESKWRDAALAHVALYGEGFIKK